METIACLFPWLSGSWALFQQAMHVAQRLLVPEFVQRVIDIVHELMTLASGLTISVMQYHELIT